MVSADEQGEIQLGVLKLLDAALSPLHIRFWLRGGWAIDFLLGRITRPHDDLDVVLWCRHRERMCQALLREGFRLIHETNAQLDLRKDGQDISFIFLARDSDGEIVTSGIPEWAWRPGALSSRHHCLHGASARVVSTQQLLAEKEGYERGTGRPPRSKDVDSMQALRQLISKSKVH